jgi:CMP-N-acetylneuraminic acid synthetase
MRSGIFDEHWVSTDDEEIAVTAEKFGASGASIALHPSRHWPSSDPPCPHG